MWRNWNPHSPLVEMKSGAATLENSLEIPQKFKLRVTIGPHRPTPMYISNRKFKKCTSIKNAYTSIHSSVVSNSQKIKPTQTSLN